MIAFKQIAFRKYELLELIEIHDIL